ncbi:hypothetical protein F5Y16DRAFT_370264 [Xylariaceae sp. FL0255]|nr:hypothetical protein F5Y16DRAFT_370264 [Xylariaceae sp. FL0255]
MNKLHPVARGGSLVSSRLRPITQCLRYFTNETILRPIVRSLPNDRSTAKPSSEEGKQPKTADARESGLLAVSQSDWQIHETQKPGWLKHGVPRLRAFNAYKATPYKLVKLYTHKLEKGYPMLISNLPGFLSSQSLIDHEIPEGSFRRSRSEGDTDDELGFSILKKIWANAISGARPILDPVVLDRPIGEPVVLDRLEAVFKIKSSAFAGEHPPILRFRDWMRESKHLEDFQLEPIIEELLEAYQAKLQPWQPFKAPLVFARAAHEYNLTQQAPPGMLAPSKDTYYVEGDYPTCITGLTALVVLEKEMTEEFPFPRIIRDIGESKYNTRSCSIRVGVRPMRTDMRRSREGTTVVGQISGYSIVTLVRPDLNALNGKPLTFHEKVPNISQDVLANKTWTRELEDELSKTGDVITATLIPGHGLLVPPGWWHGVRSIVNGLHLHSTVTWFLNDDLDQGGDSKSLDVRRLPPMVEI